MTESKAVVTIDDISEANAPAIYVKGGLNKFLDAVKVEVAAEVPDLTTKKGRDRIASQAFKVSKSKAAVEKHGRAYLAKLKEMPNVVEAELREFVRSMDALRDETRAPLTAWEEAEAARVAGHKERGDSFRFVVNTDTGAAMLKQLIAEVEAKEIGADMEEYEAEAHRAKAECLATLGAQLVTRERHEAELAAIAKFQAEQAEREAQAERDRIAQEAAERATREAEQRAHAAKEAAAQREADLIEQAAQAKRDAEAAAERQRLQLELQAEQAERQKVQAERDRIAAEQQAAQDRIDAERRQAEAVQRAAQAERQRQADEQARVEAEAKAREADRAHKGATLKAAKESIMGAGITEEQAKAVVKLIAAGKVPAITIQY